MICVGEFRPFSMPIIPFSASPVGGSCDKVDREHGEEQRLSEEEGQVHREVSEDQFRI